jgi:flagellar biosynthesis protein FlhG
MDHKNERGIRTPHDLIQQVCALDGHVGARLANDMAAFSPKLVVNQVRSKDDITLGFSMRSSCSKYFGITVGYAGFIEHDDCVWQAGKRRRPLLLEYPFSNAARALAKISNNLLRQEQMTLDYLMDAAVRR